MDFITQQIVVENVSEIVTKKRDWAEPLRLELEHFGRKNTRGPRPGRNSI